MTSTQLPFPAAKFWSAAIALWCCAAAGVWGWMTSYSCSAEKIEELADFTWPNDSSLTCSTERPTLVLFLHPLCPCSVASVHELERVLTGASIQEQQRPKLLIVATIPADQAETAHANLAFADCNKSASIDIVSKLPNVEIHWDKDGIEAQRFRATTSGTVMLFDSSQKRRFSGGVTIARGHEGASTGADSLHQLLIDSSSRVMQSTPVFGCSLVTNKSTTSSLATSVVEQPDTTYVDPQGDNP